MIWGFLLFFKIYLFVSFSGSPYFYCTMWEYNGYAFDLSLIMDIYLIQVLQF